MKIDSHHHFWQYNPIDYDWIDDTMQLLRRDFLPEQLREAIDTADVEGVISVQARQSLVETQWLLELAATNEFIKGVVGWVELTSPQVSAQLENLSAHPKLRSVRHVVQGEPDRNYILRPDFNRGIAALKSFGLAYDILVFERHLPPTIRFVDQHPEQRFVLDHIAKPRIKDGLLEPWKTNISELARRPNVYCKLSGMVTEADYVNWTEAQLQPYFETVLAAFGPQRLMFGSDWPVCLAACEYLRWHGLVTDWVAHLSPDEQARILGGTAQEAYNL